MPAARANSSTWDSMAKWFTFAPGPRQAPTGSGCHRGPVPLQPPWAVTRWLEMW